MRCNHRHALALADETIGRLKTERDEQRSRADKAEAERDAAWKRCDKLDAYVRLDSLPPDPRIEAWRALDAEQRSYRVDDLRTWADMVEAGAAPDGADHGPSPLRIAAAALEALAEGGE